ncbi:MAG: alpha/beta hydrolase, partial [Ilumatobacteraceae bacterium]
ALAALAGAGVATGLIEVPDRLKRAFKDTGPDGTIPEVAPGRVTLEVKQSQARHGEVGFFTAVPDGFGDGSGLPVCLVLHGASATTADYERFGFGQFLTAAVDSGVPPFVLAGADGGRSRWAGNGSTDDPQRMLVDELPAWCADRGFDAGRLALYGWSMGGYGALLAAIRNPGLFRAVAALSPAVGGESDEVVRRVGELDPARTAVWCGTADSLYDAVRDMAARIPGDPAIESYEPGAHTRGYWNRITPEAFAFIGRALAN